MKGSAGERIERESANRRTLFGLVGSLLLALVALVSYRGGQRNAGAAPKTPVTLPRIAAERAHGRVLSEGITPRIRIKGTRPPRVTPASTQHSPRRLRFGPLGPVTTRIEIPIRTFLHAIVAIGGLWLLVRLWDQVLVVMIALIFAVAFDPTMRRLQRRGWSRGQAVLALVLSVFGVVVLMMALIVSPLIAEGDQFADNLPGYIDDFQERLNNYPTIQEWIDDLQEERSGSSTDTIGSIASYAPSVLSLGAGLFSGIANLFIFIVLTIYLLLDGPRLFESLTDHLNPLNRYRARRLRIELGQVVGGYITGQLLVSTCFGVFTFITLTAVGAPEPLILALLAAALDAIPMIGATLATIPAVLLALTVSVPTALLVLVLFLLYQQIENYFIAPRAFRNTLKISSLAVLLAVTFGSALIGILGAMLALPVAAAIPVLVRGLRQGEPLLEGKPSVSWPAERSSDAPAVR